MSELWHEVWIAAPTERVYDALTTKAGVDGWWGHLTLRNDGRPADSRWCGFCNAAWGETLSVKLRKLCETNA